MLCSLRYRQSNNFHHPGRIACCPAPDRQPPATKTLHTIWGNNTSTVSSSWWWAYKCPKHVEQIISAIKPSVTSSWFSSLRLYNDARTNIHKIHSRLFFQIPTYFTIYLLDKTHVKIRTSNLLTFFNITLLHVSILPDHHQGVNVPIYEVVEYLYICWCYWYDGGMHVVVYVMLCLVGLIVACNNQTNQLAVHS